MKTTSPDTPCRIGILYTGGTIGMVAGQHGLTPSARLADALAPFFDDRVCADWNISEPLIDSSAVSLRNWCDWLDWVRAALPRYDALLILHGTDTLAYTANFLALALPDAGKPIVLTGAQWPFGQDGSDAPLNIRTALAACRQNRLRQTVIAFDGRLWRAVGATKTSTETAAGFVTPHFPPLAQLDENSGALLWQDCPLPEKPRDTAVHTVRSDIRVICLPLVPGANADMVADTLNRFPADAVVLQTYGHGNAPEHTALLSAVQSLTQRGIPVLNISQVQQGCAAPVYAQSSALRRAGAISGGRCNTETAVALLSIAASENWTPDQIRGCLCHWQLLPE